MKHFLLFISCWLLLFTAHAQFVNLGAERFGNLVLLQWATEAGFTCTNIEVQHSSDTLLGFSTVFVQNGVCGNADKEQAYSFTHLNPATLPTEYYRLTAAGSSVSNIFVLKNQNRGTQPYVVYPQPANETFNLQFYSSGQQRVELSLYDINGKKWLQMPIDDPQNTKINTQFLPNGVYTFRLEGINENLGGKVIILHP